MRASTNICFAAIKTTFLKKAFLSIVLALLIIFGLPAQGTPQPVNTTEKIDLASVPPVVQAGISKALNQATQKAEEVHLSNPNFKSHFTKTAVSLSPKGNDLVWEWQLKSINGQAAIPVSPLLRDAYQKELIDYDRGNITERYVFHRASIEQQFIINEMPEEGHLTIEGDILTAGTFREENDHWLWANDKSSVKLGQLYVYDATGATIPADFEVCADYTAITIEEDALATATFPVTIDPEIGPDDFRISFMGANGNSNFDAQRPAVSYNSQENRYLVVWDGDEAVGGVINDEYEIYGQYINTDGTTFLGRFRISSMGEDGQAQFDGIDPDVSYNPVTNQHLVVWRGDNSTENDLQIWGQFVDNLTQLVESDFQISETGAVVNENPQLKNGPAITYNATDDEFLVVWTGDAGSGESEIFGQILGGTGSVVADDFQISEQGPDGNTAFPAGQPDVIYNIQDNEYLVVWQGQDNAGQLVQSEVEIYGQLLNNTGAEIGTDFRISDMGNDGNGLFDGLAPAVAYNSIQNEYLVVWAGDDKNNSDFQIYAQLLDAAGAEIGDNDMQISDMDDGAGNGNSQLVFSAESPSVRYSPIENKYLVIWDGDNGGNQVEAFGQVLDASLKELSPNDFRISTIDDNFNELGEIRVNALAFNSTDGTFFSVWSGEDTGTNEEFEIFGQFLDISTIKPSGQFRISTQGSANNAAFDAVDPAIAYNSQDSNYLVVWSGGLAVGSPGNQEFEIFGQLISDEGIEIGADFRISDIGVSGNIMEDAITPDVAYNATDNNYLVVFSADDVSFGANNEFEIYGQFLDECGNEIGVDDFRISFNGPTDDAEFDAFNPNVAYNSTRNEFLVVWHGDDNRLTLVNNEFEIFGQVVDEVEGLVFTGNIRFSDMGPDGNSDFNAFNPSVAYNSTSKEYLVVWEGDDNTGGLVEGEFEIFGQRVSGLGQEIGSDFRISNQGFDGNVLFDAEDPVAAFNSTDNEYLVVWNGDFNSGNAVAGEDEIFGQLLAADGTEIGANFRISDMGFDGFTNTDATAPAITYNDVNNNYLVIWEGYDLIFLDTSTQDELEIYGQFINSTGAEIGDNDFRISEQGPDFSPSFDGITPALAFNPLNNNFLTVWAGDDNVEIVNDEFEIFGELISAQAANDCPELLTDTELGNPIPTRLYEAINTITSTGTVETGNNVTFQAGENITLNAGFTVEAGSTFSATIGTPSCFTVQELTNDDMEYRMELSEVETASIIENITLIAQPNPFHSETQLRFQLPEEQSVSMQLFDQMGRLVRTILPIQSRAAGEYMVTLRNEQGLRGMYFVVLQTKKERVIQKVLVTNY